MNVCPIIARASVPLLPRFAQIWCTFAVGSIAKSHQTRYTTPNSGKSRLFTDAVFMVWKSSTSSCLILLTFHKHVDGRITLHSGCSLPKLSGVKFNLHSNAFGKSHNFVMPLTEKYGLANEALQIRYWNVLLKMKFI
jgi:hypothetical protein